VAIATYIWNALVALFWWLDDLFSYLRDFFENLWDNFFRGIFQAIWNAYKAVHDWLENLLAPVIRILNKIRGWVQWAFNTYVKPILNVLRIVQQFLGVLKALGVKWAAQLDADISMVIGYITKYYNKALSYINAIISIVNSLADPLGLYRSPTFVMSMRRIFPSFMRGISGMPMGYWIPSPLKSAPLGMGGIPGNFNPSDPSQNPPPSTYFNYDDGLGSFGGWDGTDPLADTDADDMTSLDAFDPNAWATAPNPDPVQSLDTAQQSGWPWGTYS